MTAGEIMQTQDKITYYDIHVAKYLRALINLCGALDLDDQAGDYKAALERVNRAYSRRQGKHHPKTTYVYVNQNVLLANGRDATNNPALIVRQGQDVTMAHEVHWSGPAKTVYRPDRPQPTGARLWMESDEPVEIITGAIKTP